MPKKSVKIGFPMPTAKNGLQILNPKKYILQEKNTPFFNANLLEKFRNLIKGVT